MSEMVEPAWFTHLVRLDRAKVSWREVVRMSLTIAAPLGVGLALRTWAGQGSGLIEGVFASIGALVGAMAPQRGALRERVRRTAAGVILGAGGLAIGRFAEGGGWQPVVVVAVVAGGAALVSAVSANVSFGALQLLAYIAIGSGLTDVLPLPECVGLFLLGGVWATLLNFLAALSDPVDPDRAVVADVVATIGQLLRESGHGEQLATRQALTAAYNSAYDQITSSRGHAPGRSPRLVRLAGVLNSTSALSEAAVALYRSGATADHADPLAVAELADAVRAGRSPDGAPPPRLDHGTAVARSVRHGVRVLWAATAGVQETESGAGAEPVAAGWQWGAWWGDLVERTVANPENWRFAVRLGTCMAIAEIVREYLPFQRPYWVLLTVAIVLKPDYGSVFVRGVQRLVGTLAGVLVGAAVLALVPHDGWMLLALAVAAAVMPWAQASNYGLFVVALTPVVVILLDIGVPGGSTVVTPRLYDTLVGCGIVLVFGYLLWPRTWRSALSASLQRVVDALDAFVGAAFGANTEQRRHVRRATFRALSDLQTQLQRQLAEPPPMSTRAAAWWPVIVQLERAADSVVAAVVAVDSGTPPPPPDEIDALRRTIRQLPSRSSPAASGRDEPSAGVLVPVVREVSTARRLLREGPVTDS